MGLPAFDPNGLPPPNDYEMTLEELASSMLVEGPEEGYPRWDRDWRARLVENLGKPSGIEDDFGNDLQFPAAFRKSRREHKPKGIVKVARR